MFFYVQGPNMHDLMPLETVFDKRKVKPVNEIDHDIRISEKDDKASTARNKLSLKATYAYESVKENQDKTKVLIASQIMISPVAELTSSTTVAVALSLFHKNRFRHFPVVSSAGKVIGIVSDRDIFHYIAGLNDDGRINNKINKMDDTVNKVMQFPVITASEQTDVRYIARLFVERRIGAMPIVKDGKLSGIITRSDILHAVMSLYALELWI
jgi:acetoin utilization protein AcuB